MDKAGRTNTVFQSTLMMCMLRAPLEHDRTAHAVTGGLYDINLGDQSPNVKTITTDTTKILKNPR